MTAPTPSPLSIHDVDLSPPRLAQLNTTRHETALWLFFVLVVAHLVEHVVQAVQLWGLGWEPAEARGLAGVPFPWLIQTEALHYGYAIAMLIGFLLLRPGFRGRSGAWWALALGIQVWHHVEHFVLLLQRLTSPWFGEAVPTSFAQLVVPRVELHLIYNTMVLVPMLCAMYFHRYPPVGEPENTACSCFRAHL